MLSHYDVQRFEASLHRILCNTVMSRRALRRKRCAMGWKEGEVRLMQCPWLAKEHKAVSAYAALPRGISLSIDRDKLQLKAVLEGINLDACQSDVKSSVTLVKLHLRYRDRKPQRHFPIESTVAEG